MEGNSDYNSNDPHSTETLVEECEILFMSDNLRANTFKKVADELAEALIHLKIADKTLADSDYWSSTTERRDIFNSIIKLERLRADFIK